MIGAEEASRICAITSTYLVPVTNTLYILLDSMSSYLQSPLFENTECVFLLMHRNAHLLLLFGMKTHANMFARVGSRSQGLQDPQTI